MKTFLVIVALLINWPSFRGPAASGIADDQNLPITWDVTKGTNIKWKTPIRGLAHSSPVVWGDRVYVTTAISGRGDGSFRPGLYGDGDASDDRTPHKWNVYALDSRNGKVVWERTAYEGSPKEKRHIKATYANSTPATNGEYVVAYFGSQGLYAFDASGKPVWKRDLGVMDVGAYDAPDYEWGTASSPIIFGDLVIVQCDMQKGSFILAVDLKTGRDRWRTSRDELPSWGTPNIYQGRNGTELVTNGSNFIRGYDPATGKELWKLGGSSKITAPTPVIADDLIVVASGRRPEAPVFVLRGGSRGDLTLEEGKTASQQVIWSKRGRGSYMPTPLAYRGQLYVLANQGIIDCYDLRTGDDIYRERIQHGGSGFSASPVASDGRLYLSSEDGDIFVVTAGPKFELLAKNSMGELLMATPAISSGKLFVRSQHHVFAIGN